MRHYKLIIFDLDDTLFDYVQTERFAVTATCRSVGISLADDLYFRYKLANDKVRETYRGITGDNIQQFRLARATQFLTLTNRSDISPHDFVRKYLEYSTSGTLISGVQDALEALHGIRKVVATNGTTYPRLNKLEGSAIAKYFERFFSAEALGVAKPSAAYFLKIIQYCNVPREEVLAVGDDYSLDVECAINAGIDCCWFNYSKKPLARALPATVTVIDRFTDLVGVVGRTPYD